MAIVRMPVVLSVVTIGAALNGCFFLFFDEAVCGMKPPGYCDC
jgi:hypothetical protein